MDPVSPFLFSAVRLVNFGPFMILSLLKYKFGKKHSPVFDNAELDIGKQAGWWMFF